METRAVIVLLAAAMLHAQAGAPVQGRVVNTATGAAVKRAVVTLKGDETYLVQTDALGRFSLKDVAPGRYELDAAREGYKGKPEAAVTIGPEGAKLELHLIPLGTIAGRISDLTGDPIADATVEAMTYRYVAGRKQLQSSMRVTTNDRGEYLLADVAPSRYYLRATQPNQDPPIFGDVTDRGPRRQQVFAASYYPGTRDADRATMLGVTAGGELQHVDLRLQQEGVYSIRGRVAPQNSARLIQLRDTQSGGHALRSPQPGEFEFWGLPPGAYALESDRQATLFAMRKVEILNDDVAGVDLTSPTSVAVTGRVQGDIGSGARVLLQSLDSARLDLNTSVQADGSFSLGAQPEGYVVHVQGGGAWLQSMMIGDKEVPDHRFVPGQMQGALTLVASREAGQISGRVTGEDGQPVPGVNVTLVPDQTVPYWWDSAQTAKANGSGQFTMEHVIPGTYRLFAVVNADAGAPFDPEFRKPFEAKGVAVKVNVDSAAIVQLTAIEMK